MSIPLNYTLVALSAFYDYVIPEIRGYVPSLVDQAIREAAIEFCRKTRIWRETKTHDVTADTANIAISLPDKSVVMEVRRAAYDGNDLDPFIPEEMDDALPGWQSETGTPRAYALVDEDEVVLYPVPDASLSDGLETDAIYVPTYNADELPSFLRDRHSALIAMGAKARLMAMGNKPWTDRELSMKYAEDFAAGIGTQAARAAAGRTRLPLRVATCHGVK